MCTRLGLPSERPLATRADQSLDGGSSSMRQFLALGLIVAFSACGGGSSPTAAPSSTPPPATPAPSPTPTPNPFAAACGTPLPPFEFSYGFGIKVQLEPTRNKKILNTNPEI